MSDERRLPLDPRFLAPTPFARLVGAHAIAVCGDACIAVSLAGSLFFEGATSGSREKVLLYLLLSMAPFVVVAGVLGSMLDRTQGGRRLLVILSMLGRAVLALAMAQFITRKGADGLLVYPLAFGVLVLQKGYSVAKSSLVPALVADDQELVKANSRLALVSSVATLVGGAPAVLVQWVFDASWSLVLASVVFAVATVLATKIPPVQAVTRTQEERELAEISQPSILLAGSAMGVLRGAVGFVVFFSAFSLRDDVLALGFAGAVGAAGAFVGNATAPAIRRRIREEVILASAIGGAATLALLGALTRGALGFAIACFGVAVGAACGKLGFDSLLQRDGPDAVRGRAFARFETRFQFLWVLGALLGIVPAAEALGLAGLGLVLLFAGLSYYAALRAARARVYRTTIRPQAVDRAFDRARTELRQRRATSRRGRRSAAASRRRSRRAASPADARSEARSDPDSGPGADGLGGTAPGPAARDEDETDPGATFPAPERRTPER
jgi:hypothetical protein